MGFKDIRSALAMDESTSMLCASERQGHFHLLFIPEFKGNPPTLGLLQRCLMPVAHMLRVELYPQKNRCFRLPFGYNQVCLDEGKELLDWRELLYWFKKLNPIQIDQVPKVGCITADSMSLVEESFAMDLEDDPSAFVRGSELLKRGLIAPHTRAHSQFLVLYYLWRKCIPLEQAIVMVQHWIRRKHNGYSTTVGQRRWRRIDDEIIRQASSIWWNYEIRGILPDSVRMRHEGWTTKSDLLAILVRCKYSFRLARFMYRLLKFSYPRTAIDQWIPIHSKKLKDFASSQTYLDFLDRLQKLGIIDRMNGYRTGIEAKRIKLIWNFDRKSDPFLINGRSPETFDKALSAAFSEDQLLEGLRSAGCDVRAIASVRRTLAKGKHAI